MNRRSSRRHRILLGTVLCLLAACGRPDHEATPTPNGPEVVVRTEAVKDTVLSRPIRATGTLSSKEEVPLSFKIGGVVARLEVEEGARVPAGRRLASLERPEIDAAVAKALAAAEKADRDLARARALHADSVVTLEVLQNAETGARVAASDLEIARFNLRHAEITAPSDGVILRRLAEPGQLVAPGTPILYFGATGKGTVVRAGLVDREVVRVALDDPAEIGFDAFPDRQWTGRVTRKGSAATPGVGTYEVEIRLDRPITDDAGTSELASGLVAEVTIHPRRTERVAQIPTVALIEGNGDRATVWSLGPDLAPRRHAIRIVGLEDDRVFVGSGLEGIERIVTDGAAYLTESSRVRPAADR